MHDDYKPLPCAPDKLERCPVCGSEAGLWQYSESDTAPRKLLVMCSHGEKIGPQNGLIHEGCLLYMPGDDFYRETERDAIRYWNEFARALVALRTANASGVTVAPAEQFHEAVLAIIGDLMKADPAADSVEGRLLVRLADAVEAYEKVVYPMPTPGVSVPRHQSNSEQPPTTDAQETPA